MNTDTQKAEGLSNLATVSTLSQLPVIAVENMPAEKAQKIQTVLAKISLKSPADIIYYGVDPQRQAASLAEKIIGDTKTKDAGPVGDLLNSMLLEIKDLNLDSLEGSGNFLSKLPIVGGMFDQVRGFISQYESVASKIEKTSNALDREAVNMMRSVQSLEAMYESNIDLIHELEVYIEAGKLYLTDFNAKLPGLVEKAKASGDAMEIQKVSDLSANANRFEKRLYDLVTSRHLSIQTAPTLRMMQHGAAELADKLQSSVVQVIPLWKQQMAIGIEMYRQKKAMELQRKVSDTSNEMFRKNAELLRTGQVGIAKESERAIIDISTLKSNQENLISTIQEVLRIHDEGKAARKANFVEIERMEDDLKVQLANLQQPSRA